MTRATLAGLLVIGVPLFALAVYLFWRRQKQIVAFALALVSVGLGYLAINGAAADVGRMIPGLQGWIKAGVESAKPAAGQTPDSKTKPDTAEKSDAKPDPAKPEPVTPAPAKPAPDKPASSKPAPGDPAPAVQKPVETPNKPAAATSEPVPPAGAAPKPATAASPTAPANGDNKP